MERNLPATRTDADLAVTRAEVAEHRAEPLPRRQPISVAFLPLALVTFLVLVFVMALWTFLAVGN